MAPITELEYVKYDFQFIQQRLDNTLTQQSSLVTAVAFLFGLFGATVTQIPTSPVVAKVLFLVSLTILSLAILSFLLVATGEFHTNMSVCLDKLWASLDMIKFIGNRGQVLPDPAIDTLREDITQFRIEPMRIKYGAPLTDFTNVAKVYYKHIRKFGHAYRLDIALCGRILNMHFKAKKVADLNYFLVICMYISTVTYVVGLGFVLFST